MFEPNSTIGSAISQMRLTASELLRFVKSPSLTPSDDGQLRVLPGIFWLFIINCLIVAAIALVIFPVMLMLGIEMSKQQQSSDWGTPVLSDAQKQYAALDVIYLHELKARFDKMLRREGREELARNCFDFLATRTHLDLLGWSEDDIFAH